MPEAAPAETRRCLDRFFAWGAAPTVDAYCELFARDGTLLDADMDRPIGGEAIRESITRVLQLLPDFRFAPKRVLVEGRHAFVLAANRATLGDRALAWDAVYALTLHGDRIGAGRRYYDQAALLTGADTFRLDEATGRDDAGTLSPRKDGALDLSERTAIWNRGDLSTLRLALGPVRLHLAGLTRPMESDREVAAGLAAFAARSEGLRVRPTAVARDAASVAVEWTGTIGRGPAARRFALVELCTPLRQRCEWRLLFNTLGL
jgi:hypothetical protein